MNFQLLEKVRGHEDKKQIPVFIITSNSTDEVRVNSYKTGATDFFDRLIKKDELITRIQVKIDQARESASLITIGCLKLNLKKMSCELEKKYIDLTMLEFQP